MEDKAKNPEQSLNESKSTQIIDIFEKMIIESPWIDKITRMMLDNVMMGVSMISPEMEIVWLNRIFKEWFPQIDVQKKPLCYRSFYSPPKDKICDYCPTKKAFETGKVHFAETGICADGRIYNLIAVPVKDKDGKIIYVVETVENITERKQAQDTLQESEERFRKIFEEGQLGMALVGRDYQIIDANNKLCQMLGYTREELTKLKFTDFTHPDDIDKDVQLTERIFKEEIPFYQLEKRYIKKNKDIIWVDLTASVIHDKEGKPLYGLGMIEDITERKQAEEELIRSEERYRHITSSLTDYIFTVYVDNGQPVKTVHGPGCISVTGYSPEEFISNPCLWICMVYEPDRQTVYEYTQQILSGKKVSPLEHRIIRKDGSIRWIRNTTVSHFDNQGKLLLYDGLIKDITEQRQAEEALRESEDKFRSLAEKSLAAVYLIQNGIFKYVNPRFAGIFGYTVDELVGKKGPKDLAFSEDWPIVEENMRKRLTGEAKFIYYNFRGITKDKKIIHVEIYGSLIEYKMQPAIIGTLLDITERKQMLDALQKQKEEQQIILDSVPAMIFYKDKENRFIRINKALADATGLPKEKIEGKTAFEAYPGYAEKYWEDDKEVMASGQPKTNIIEPMETTKGIIWCQTDKIPYRDEQGNIIGIIGFAIDISERKQAEEDLKIEQDKAQRYLEIATVMLVVIDAKGKVVLMNKKGCEILGYNQEEIIGKNWFDNFLPERIRFDVKEVARKLLAGNIKPVEYYENPVLTKSGHEKIIAWHNTVLRDEEGKIIAHLSSGEDITERKQIEKEKETLYKELIKSNQRLKQLILRDPHTGLYNHRYLSEVIEAELFRAKRFGNPLSVMMLDVDYFKSINDVYGNQFGDLVLKQLARQLKNMVRRYDTVIRFGGEEFIIISPGMDRVTALNLAHRLLDAVNLFNFGDNKNTVKLKLSVGVASYPEDKIVSGMDLVDLASKILNKVKESGGNQIYSSLDIKKESPRALKKHKEETADVQFLKNKIEKLSKQANQSLSEAIFAFAKTLKVKDHYTGEHTETTVHYATEIARELDLPRDEIEHVRQAAILHDLGKIGISEKILLKPAKLTKKEFNDVKKHPQIGVDIIRPLQFLHPLIPLVLYHHERWDGKGYPRGLKTDEIPVGARIIAIADVYQALISTRPYRKKAYSKSEAIKIIANGSGTQFDPYIVSSFLKILKQEK